jgi:hypothetical protein
MLKYLNKTKKEVKELFYTLEGWLSWFIANVITSLPWVVPLVYGFLFEDNRGYIIAGSIWTFIMLPITPVWIINIIIALYIKNILLKRVIIKT